MPNVSWQDIQEISDVIIELAPLKAAFPVLVRVLQISMTMSALPSVKGLFQPSSVSISCVTSKAAIYLFYNKAMVIQYY